MAGIYSLEKRILYDTYGKLLWMFRRQPAHAAFWLAGVALPPHERFWMGVFFGDTKENSVVASRGTSKSFTHASLAAPLYGVLYKNVKITTLSASGFRGGKELFKDAERLFYGQLKSQESPGIFLLAATTRQRPVTKDPSLWEMAFKSNSTYNTAPTNNPDQLRGLRSNTLLIDERNTFDGEVVQKVLRPMLNVGMDFRRAASGGDDNKIYQVSTIDFTVRDWYPELQVAEGLEKREFEAAQARKEGNWDEYDRLLAENDNQLRTASFSMTKIDYTDLLIPEYVTTLDGQNRYRVEYPLESGIEREDVLRYDEGDRISYWYTYPVNKGDLERPLRDGTADPEIWLAEQRNVFIKSSGNVFDFDLIQRIAERPVWTAKDSPGSKWRKKTDEDDDITKEEYYAPVLYSCGDPCVAGFDYARESDDAAIIVIRLGELAEGEFDPFVPHFDNKGRTVLGKTSWNHICWAEAQPHLESGEFAEKMRDIYARYNIIATFDIPGMALDQRGGGSAVRDDLGNPKPKVIDGKPDATFVFEEIMKIYDPEDTNGFAHYAALDDPSQYWGGLRLLATQNKDNVAWTYGMRALMQAKKLYIAFWMPPSRWAFEKGLLNGAGEPDRMHPEYIKWEVGYNGIRRLKTQLLRLQTKVSEKGTITFVMPGNRQKEEGKKDLWAAGIYAVSLAREHLNAQTKQDAEAPMVQPILIQANEMGALSGLKLVAP